MFKNSYVGKGTCVARGDEVRVVDVWSLFVGLQEVLPHLKQPESRTDFSTLQRQTDMVTCCIYFHSRSWGRRGEEGGWSLTKGQERPYFRCVGHVGGGCYIRRLPVCGACRGRVLHS